MAITVASAHGGKLTCYDLYHYGRAKKVKPAMETKRRWYVVVKTMLDLYF